MSDPNRTQMISGAPSADPNRTIMGNAPTLNATQTIKPVQCPVCKTFNPVGVMFCVECGLIFDRALPGDAFGAPAVQLPCLVDPSGREHFLRPGPNVLGRQGDLVFDDGRVSRKHAQITLENGQMLLEDLGSTNGTKADGNALAQGEKRAVASGNKISLGGYELVLSTPGESAKTAMGLSGRTAAISAPPKAVEAAAWAVFAEGEKQPLKNGTSTFGRKSDNDLQIVDPYVSGRHGTIEITDLGIFLTDTGSTNGTLLNDAKLGPNQRVQITAQDVIKLGSVEFHIQLEEGV
ncbi:MAG: FHA domain-containing protein [Fimbriimonadaceae bacterium]|nr:FHA domain-containing protein [Fimbriimonadaceae bacterium]